MKFLELQSAHLRGIIANMLDPTPGNRRDAKDLVQHLKLEVCLRFYFYSSM